MTPDEWETSNDALDMLFAVQRGRRDQPDFGRRVQRYYLGCCGAIWPLLPQDACRFGVAVAERCLDGRDGPGELEYARRQVVAAVAFYAESDPVDLAGWVRAADTLSRAERASLLHTDEARGLGGLELLRRAAAFVEFAVCCRPSRHARPGESNAAFMSAGLMRCVFANPLRAPTMKPSWRTADVVGLALGIDADGAYDRLPLLADALMDAGCDDDQLLAHTRADGHVRGCWLVDLALGKE
jgi:hypothetical protein